MDKDKILKISLRLKEIHEDIEPECNGRHKTERENKLAIYIMEMEGFLLDLMSESTQAFMNALNQIPPEKLEEFITQVIEGGRRKKFIETNLSKMLDNLKDLNKVFEDQLTDEEKKERNRLLNEIKSFANKTTGKIPGEFGFKPSDN